MKNPFHSPSTPKKPHTLPLHFSTYLQIIKSMNESDLTDRYKNRNNSSAKSSEVLPAVWWESGEIYRIEGGTYSLFFFLAPIWDALSNILPQFQPSVCIIFHRLKFPAHFWLSLDRWQADADDRQIHITMVTQEQFHSGQSRTSRSRGRFELFDYKTTTVTSKSFLIF